MARTTAGVSFDLVTTAATTVVDGLGAQAPLGFKLLVPSSINDGVSTVNAGDQTWIYVQNSTGAAWAAGTLVQRTAAALTYQCTISSGAIDPARIVGVSQHAIAAGSFGFILREGRGLVLCDGNVSADSSIVPDANAGQCTDSAAVTDDAIGVALATDAGAASTVAAQLNCLG